VGQLVDVTKSRKLGPASVRNDDVQTTELFDCGFDESDVVFCDASILFKLLGRSVGVASGLNGLVRLGSRLF